MIETQTAAETTVLRGYQAFGARFALAQQRAIIGDEMGCGKTVEAVAAMAHLRAEGERHFLVVCPASVLINWMREVRGHSTLRPYRLHGAGRDEQLLAWAGSGGVGVTTFESVRSITLPRVRVAMLVVDEAHYVKNPDTQRSKALAAWTRRIERVLFLTGTPIIFGLPQRKTCVFAGSSVSPIFSSSWPLVIRSWM